MGRMCSSLSSWQALTIWQPSTASLVSQQRQACHMHLVTLSGMLLRSLLTSRSHSRRLRMSRSSWMIRLRLRQPILSQQRLLPVVVVGAKKEEAKAVEEEEEEEVDFDLFG